MQSRLAAFLSPWKCTALLMWMRCSYLLCAESSARPALWNLHINPCPFLPPSLFEAAFLYFVSVGSFTLSLTKPKGMHDRHSQEVLLLWCLLVKGKCKRVSKFAILGDSFPWKWSQGCRGGVSVTVPSCQIVQPHDGAARSWTHRSLCCTFTQSLRELVPSMQASCN